MRFAAALATTLTLIATVATAQQEGFPGDVLQILSDRCFTCHGPDAEARKADLRLDDKASAFALRDGVAAIVAGDPAQSELIRRITATDDDVMPPRDSNLHLSPAEIAALRHWIAEGAEWPVHWAFAAPPTIATPPKLDGLRNAIDAFVRRKLALQGIPPAEPATPAALLRRVSLDLTGLPPTPEQLDAFVRDPSHDAYARIVDELLASPHYGERMAWPWLEASRYADTDGFQNDPTRTSWPWRDWLVQALNDNLPFDQFTTQVLAGDLLPNATPEQRLASGFLRNNAHNGEGGRIAEETRIENGFDRTETVSTVWMGLTFECARCHDHKYDPISQRDYYSLFAFFNQTSETGRGRSGGKLPPTMQFLGDRTQRARLLALDAQLQERILELRAADPELDRGQVAWETQTAATLSAETEALQPSQLGPWLRSKQFAPGPQGKDAMFGHAFGPESQATIRAGDDWQSAPELVDGKAHAFPNGEYTLYFHRSIDAKTARRMHASFGSDDAIKVWCNGELLLQNNARRGVAADQERVVLPLRPGRNELLVKIVNTGGLGGFYFRRVDETVFDLAGEIVRALLADRAKRSTAQQLALQRHYRLLHVEGYAERVQQLQTLQAEQQQLRNSGLDVSVMDELPPSKRRKTHVLERGDYQQRREEVTAGTPSFLPPLPTVSARNRLSLAQWLVSGKNPLTARVAVNRAWLTLFGRGLVATPEDFGRQGDRPSHPELLDWLANDFVASGWDVKALHRRIVTSQTYRQSAAATTAAFARDPNNTLLARSARHRLPAWMLRDQALALSGRLVARVGGQPVRPYQPDGVWAEATFDFIRYQQGKGDDLYRRSLYVFWRRIVGPTAFFDTQARQACVVRRSITNTPLHALTTLNETGFVESARGLATRAWHAGENPAARINWLFRAATARRPTPSERQLLLARLQDSLEHFARIPGATAQLLAVGEAPVDKTIAGESLAALTVIASIVLNLDEVLTKP
tara:strand:- start:2550 stop:5501 length:2952 start_codon:yes stop_codon:yes gene_type:complete